MAFLAIVLKVTLFAIVAGMDAFLFSTNPFIFVPVGLGVGIVTVKMSGKIELLTLGALAGVLPGSFLVFLSGIERSLLIWMGVSIAALIATCLMLYPRIRRRFAQGTLFFASFGSVLFIATSVILAMFLYPIPLLQISGVQASFAAANSPSNRKLLLDYTSQINDSAAGMNYLELLNWTRRHLTWSTATSKTSPLATGSAPASESLGARRFLSSRRNVPSRVKNLQF